MADRGVGMVTWCGTSTAAGRAARGA